MEDALVLFFPRPYSTPKNSLNPCFNGRCTRTRLTPVEGGENSVKVLILVLMEDALVRLKIMNTIDFLNLS